VLLNQWYDPAAIVAACQGYHHAPGTPGAPPTFSIAQFVRMELVRAWADTCSDPALEELLATNLLVRWFVGLPLTQPGPTTPPWLTSTPGCLPTPLTAPRLRSCSSSNATPACRSRHTW